MWTKDHGRAMRMAKRLDFGCVWINTHIPLVAEMPHGGFKHSGYGKDLSMYGFEDYTRIKHVMSNIDGVSRTRCRVSVDLVLHGGTVVTGDPAGPRARAVAVHDG